MSAGARQRTATTTASGSRFYQAQGTRHEHRGLRPRRALQAVPGAHEGPDFADRMRAAAQTAKDKRKSEKEGGKWKSNERLARQRDINDAIKSVRPIFISPNGNERLINNIRLIEREEGWYDVHAHGEPGSIQVFGSDNVRAKDLSHIITSREDYHGEAIRLFSCHSAEEDADGRCMGRDLAGIMNVDVRAAPGRTYIRDDGTFWFEHTGNSDFVEFRGNGDGG